MNPIRRQISNLRSFILPLILLLFIQNQTSGQRRFKNGFHQVKHFRKNFVKVDDNLYACRFETSNSDYHIFINDVKGRMNPSIYQGLLPDTGKWIMPNVNNRIWMETYFSQARYALYPVVNISYEQANFYLNWLTQKYNSNPKRPFKKVVFILPSRSQWAKAACSSNMENKFPWGATMESKPYYVDVNYCPQDYRQKIWVDSIYTNEGKRIRSGDSVEVFTECHPYTKKITSYTWKVNERRARQTESGLFNVAGNVSEMVNQKGDCIGGNFKSREDWLRADAPNEFFPGYVPCPLIGFRVFMLVLEK